MLSVKDQLLFHRLGTAHGNRRQRSQKSLSGCPVSPPVATYSSGRFIQHFIGAGRRLYVQAIDSWRARGKTATELDDCPMGVSCGLAVTHSRYWHSGGAQRNE
jgi:hypothetical protein